MNDKPSGESVRRWMPTNTGEMSDTVTHEDARDVMAEYVLATDHDALLADQLQAHQCAEQMLKDDIAALKEQLLAAQRRLGEAERVMKAVHKSDHGYHRTCCCCNCSGLRKIATQESEK
jgi:hypothetical protein